MPVITISGPTGGGALEVGQLVAKKMGLDYVDREILAQAAQALGVTVAAVEHHDERRATFGERLSALLRNFLEKSATAGATDPMLGTSGLEMLLARTYSEAVDLPEASSQEPDETTYIRTITGVIQSLAERGNVVILGRGSQAILRDWPQSLHVLVTAPLKQRIEHVARRDGLSLEEAAKRVHENDRGRHAFHRKFFKVDVDDPCLYDLVVQTRRLSHEAAAELVVAAAHRTGREEF